MKSKGLPAITWTLVAINLIVFIWDREGRIFGPPVVFSDVAMRPNEVARALLNLLAGDPSYSFPFATLFMSMFMHVDPLHLIGNMLFLLAFGRNVESAFGPFRYMLYYLFWGVAAGAVQVIVDPRSPVPIVGASGAIGGVLGAYLLLFPSARIRILVPNLLFLPLTLDAWVLLGVWFLWQILLPQDGVASWAHAGGFLAGMVTVLIMGGPGKILPNRRESEGVIDV